MFVPNMPWAVAVALGAIVAPPDAAAATAVLKQLRPPQRLLVILEGESLFNDASALLIYRLALGVALAGAPLSLASAVPTLLGVTIGSVVLGVVLSRVIIALTTRIDDVSIAVIVQFCGTFAVWTLAERLHLSGILTVVVFAMAAARRAAESIPARMRIPTYAVWEVTVFVLNVLAFILVGFQLKAILGRIDSRTLAEYAVVGAAVCVATMVARIAWVSAAAAFGRWRCRPSAPSPRAAALVGWCGMRGIVTLAAALALPTTAAYRDLVLFVAFCVVLGTLVIQGMTLRPLMSMLRLEDDGSVDREVQRARVEILRAALAATAELHGDEIAALLRRRYEVMIRRAEGGRTPEVDGDVVRTALAAERHRLVALRADGTIGDPAFQRLEQELDLEELHLQQLVPVSSS
jgi:CPA1 family monovalent cation:H+ antiporter